MKSIMTAIGNPVFNKELRKQKNIKIIGKDIQYREAILDILEKNKKIDYIILNEEIPGEIDFENLINKIKEIKKEIKIIFFLKQEDKEKEKLLKELGITEIYLEKKINLQYLINIIEERKIKNNKIIKKIENNKIIIITGLPKTGKTTLTILFTNILLEKNKKILIINFNKKTENNYLKLIRNKKNKNKIIKINNNLDLIWNFNSIIKNKEKSIEEILRELKEEYNYILIDMGFNNKNIKKEIYFYCDKIFLLINGDILEIKKTKNLFKKEINYFFNKRNNLYLIQNKYFFKSVHFQIIKNIINKKIYKIFYNKKYRYLIKNLLKKEKIKINKIIKNNLYKIIK